MNQTGFWIIGVLVTAFFTLIWRRLDTIEKKTDGIDSKLNLLTGDFREFKGKTEALLSKPNTVPVQTETKVA